MKIGDDIKDVLPVKGSYVLIIELADEQPIAVGSLGSVNFSSGYYAYVGSALSGIIPRLERHLRKEKKIHWHIDYLLQRAAITNIISCETEDRIECAVAQAIGWRFHPIPGFGCSDCNCYSHLFYSTEEMEWVIMILLDSMSINPQLLAVDDVRNYR